MKSVTLFGFAQWFGLLGILLGIPSGVILTWYVSEEWQGLLALVATLAALPVARTAIRLKVRPSKDEVHK